MKTYEILELVRPYLFDPDKNPSGDTRICYAISRYLQDHPEAYTFDEEDKAVDDVCNAVEAVCLTQRYSMLFGAALEAGLLNHIKPLEDQDLSTRHPGYVAFRDKWLDNLIEQLKEADRATDA